LLRDLLAERIAAVPGGGAIDWVTYYFRDRRLARDLVAARRRGVDVRVTLDGHPRTPGANDAVIGLLTDGLADGLRVVRHPMDGARWGKLLRPRLHEKLYCFSHPEPAAFVGSFNPSGDVPEESPDVLREIGDHDRGHNVLVELRGTELAAPLVAHARHLHASCHGALDRFSPRSNRALVRDGIEIHFWPRVRPDPILRRLARLGPGSRVRLAASHISGPTSRRVLVGLAARGVELAILTEATHRRVPPAMEQRLAAAGIPIRRVLHADEWIPMHNKFALVEANACRSVIFGSYNWSEPSRRLNREIGVIARDAALFDAFAARWEDLWPD
jgi:phosphatidylserine/phosphatidylglycerophosphate/cardiolipin synthase-like enzyme